MKTVSIIGQGCIGRAFAEGLGGVDGWRIGRVLTRRPRPGVAMATTDPKVFLSRPADLIVDAAGPEALRALGARALAVAPVWSVGAVAMADPDGRAQMAAASRQSGHGLRLFACGMADMPLVADEMRITMRAPEITESWEGKLSDAVARWPDRLNTAVAVALNGPGLAATTLRMRQGAPGTPHRIELEGACAGITWRRAIRFDMETGAAHPVALMLLAELRRTVRFWHGV